MRRLFMFLGGVFLCFFCNPENKPSGCSAKINRAQIYHFIVCDAILQARQTLPNSEKKYNHQFKHRAAVNKLLEMAMLIEHTARKYFEL